MDLSDRKLLNRIRLHSSRGENRIVSELIQKRLHNLAHVETVEHLQNLTKQEMYDKVLEEIPLYRELYPHDEIIKSIEGTCMILSCVEKE